MRFVFACHISLSLLQAFALPAPISVTAHAEISERGEPNKSLEKRSLDSFVGSGGHGSLGRLAERSGLSSSTDSPPGSNSLLD
ncbi:hypothetical protein PCANC_00730 [Puccinia coronata f. sp. avenae]|uniref:RxLR effector candidate protein n=1 Tax=Puccinia coronata f. sp. avenae TaxID=200324 RepID=A0A2N5S447_9BASI|nr:hypothetical protein PCANC_23334 [Puccinia coronata f. sp. avenae]PLW09119.1 hypothetical protein PCANC_21588 [Puccinia coronata f. sp. avenae]PLW33966.1 hypothetical protein PCASD_12346 [Puccinia coronata f. sp. avenae]PLW58035.1 hypothetical protein PCANC_00730 [Puccinia coronata f. sp. avenae]